MCIYFIYVYVRCSSDGGGAHTKDLLMLLKLLPMAIFFMLCVIGASQVRLLCVCVKGGHVGVCVGEWVGRCG
jgi:hypothetical protein